MRQLAFLLLLFSSVSSLCQKNDFDSFKPDTIIMKNINLSKVVAFEVNEAIVYMDYIFFKEKLYAELKGCQKHIKKRERIKDNEITRHQLSEYRKQYATLDSVYKYLKTINSEKDTAFILYSAFANVGSSFGDFLHVLIESNRCIIMDKNKNRQPFIIRQMGSKKTGRTTGMGSTLYFLPGHERPFWSKMNWVS
jgi:hypothetical protein